jgi:hypothetical protein
MVKELFLEAYRRYPFHNHNFFLWTCCAFFRVVQIVYCFEIFLLHLKLSGRSCPLGAGSENQRPFFLHFLPRLGKTKVQHSRLGNDFYRNSIFKKQRALVNSSISPVQNPFLHLFLCSKSLLVAY